MARDVVVDDLVEDDRITAISGTPICQPALHDLRVIELAGLALMTAGRIGVDGLAAS